MNKRQEKQRKMRQKAQQITNRALHLMRAGQDLQAIPLLNQALSIVPNAAVLHDELGSCLARLDRWQEAHTAFARAVALAPDHAEHWRHMARTLQKLEQHHAEREAWRRVVALKPDDESALKNLLESMLGYCDWTDLDELQERFDRVTDAKLEQGQLPREKPFANAMRQDNPARNRAIAEAWAAEYGQAASPLPPVGGPKNNEKLRIGYLCRQWFAHPVMQSMCFVIEAHDRRRFDVIGFAYGQQKSDPFQRRSISAVDQWVELDITQPHQSAQEIRDHNIDVLIDLTGHTDDPCLAILAWRPAPVQMSYLGYLGTSGAGYIDGLITDPALIPQDHARHYREQLYYLPDSFLSMGQAAEADEVPTNRKEQGLPDDALVLASFNQTRKILPFMFEAWLDLLDQLPEAVLWLYTQTPEAFANLAKTAEIHGINAERLIHAPKVNYFHHLARLHLADIALDSFPYGGGVTTANLLWAGVPVVSLAGRHAVTRMGASLLGNAESNPNVTFCIENYKKRVLQLARKPEKPIMAKDLFNPLALARHLETIYQEAAENHKTSGRRQP